MVRALHRAAVFTAIIISPPNLAHYVELGCTNLTPDGSTRNGNVILPSRRPRGLFTYVFVSTSPKSRYLSRCPVSANDGGSAPNAVFTEAFASQQGSQRI